MNNLLKKLVITKQTLYLKDIFYIYKETNRQEDTYQFFSKILSKFKRVRVA